MRFIRTCLDFVLPPRCWGCQASTARDEVPLVCRRCWDAVDYIRASVCVQCGQPLAAPPEGIAMPLHRCGRCLLTPPAYHCARAVGLYRGVLRDLIHAMKYHPVYGLVEPLGALMQAQFHYHWGAHLPTALVPVPLHRQRLHSREFDQALALARCISQSVGIPVWSDLLIRHRHTRPQVGLSAVARRRNIHNAFTVSNAQRCVDERLLLIDDVYTTGATVQECARLLRRSGAVCVDVYTLARVDSHGTPGPGGRQED